MRTGSTLDADFAPAVDANKQIAVCATMGEFMFSPFLHMQPLPNSCAAATEGWVPVHVRS